MLPYYVKTLRLICHRKKIKIGMTTFDEMLSDI